MKNGLDANKNGNSASTNPYAMLGAGQLASALWKTSDTREQFAYGFNVFRMCAVSGEVTQRFTPDDLPNLARLTRVLAFEIAEDGCLDGDLRDDLSCLAACLDDVVPSGERMLDRRRPSPYVAHALQYVLDYLIEDEGKHFAQNPSSGHVYRRLIFLACWLDGHLANDEEVFEVTDLEPLHYFGVCPICAKTDGYVNVRREHWLVCRDHHLRWRASTNLASNGSSDCPSKRDANWSDIRHYRVVHPFYPVFSG